MEKKHGRQELRRLMRQNRIEENKKKAARKHFAAIKARNKGQEVITETRATKPPVYKQDPKWFNRRKKVMMTRVWAKNKGS